jgi:glycerol kinase
VLGIPVKALDMKETTALGAALVAFTGLGIYKSIEEAFGAVESSYEISEPGENREKYKEVQELFVKQVFMKE